MAAVSPIPKIVTTPIKEEFSREEDDRRDKWGMRENCFHHPHTVQVPGKDICSCVIFQLLRFVSSAAWTQSNCCNCITVFIHV